MRKRWIIGGIVLVGLGAVYTGYWFWLARAFEQNLDFWVDQQRAMGFRIAYAASEARGFPLLARIDVIDVSVDSPAGLEPWRFKVPSMRLGLAPWRPMTLRIQDNSATTGYRLQWRKDGRSFELIGAGIETTIGLSSEATTPAIAFGAEHLDLRENDQSIANAYRLSAEIVPAWAAISADGSITFSLEAQQLNLVIGSPSKRENKEIYYPQLEGKLFGAFPAGPLREALNQWTRQGGYLNLTKISADPEGLFPPRFEGAASIALDPQLQPIVAASVTLHDYIPAIDQAVAGGLMTPAQGTATKVWLSARAENDNGKLKATLPITIQDGFVSTGSIKLAQVPHIAWD